MVTFLDIMTKTKKEKLAIIAKNELKN